ncbi:MAG: transposase [Micrococcales bacterium]|nr:transposase [Micrococcales bacterium]
MANSYRPVLRDQAFLLPPDMREWLPADHLVWFLLDTVDAVDTGAFDRCRRLGGAGAPGYDPTMLLGLLMYAYCRGVRSSRQIERLCGTDVAFRVLCAQDVPDHCTIARFRADCQDAFAGLFTQVLLVAAHAGLARFGTVAIDGTKIAANASLDANRGQEWLEAQVGEMIADAEQTDTAEDAAAGGERPTDRVPGPLGDRSGRARRIREAAAEVAAQAGRRARADQERDEAALERRRRSEAGEPVRGRIPQGPHRLAEAQAHLAREVAEHQAKLDRRTAAVAQGRILPGRPPVSMDASSRVARARRVVQAAVAEQAAQAIPGKATKASRAATAGLPKIVANTTDPQSRIMPTRKGFVQGYNTQVAVTADQVIVAVQVGQATTDQGSFVPMMHAAQEAATLLHAHTGSHDQLIGTVLADAGYASDANLAAPGPARLIALGKNRDQFRAAKTTPATGPPPPGATPRQAMDHRLRTTEGAQQYKRRGATVEPGIGNLKKIIDRFSRRGIDTALSEIHLAVTAFNLLKIHRAAA